MIILTNRNKIFLTFILLNFFISSCGNESKQSSGIKIIDTSSVSIATAPVNASRTDSIGQIQVKIQKPPEYNIEVVKKYSHNIDYYTQGFIVHKGYLYEGTGQYGKSKIIKMNLITGSIVKEYSLPPQYFGEGITILNGNIYQLTWRSGVCFVYNAEDLKFNTIFNYDGEGWGITDNGSELIMTNGTNQIKFISPKNFSLIKSLFVFDGDVPLFNLNELEYIEGEIWANIYGQDRIVKIDPQTAQITGWIDISILRNYLSKSDRVDVLNGIAYDKATKKLFLTGKNWPWVFEVRLKT